MRIIGKPTDRMPLVGFFPLLSHSESVRHYLTPTPYSPELGPGAILTPSDPSVCFDETD